VKRSDKIWLAAMSLFWISFALTFLIDYLGIVETSNLGFVETIWLAWILWTVGLGFTLAIVTRFVVKE